MNKSLIRFRSQCVFCFSCPNDCQSDSHAVSCKLCFSSSCFLDSSCDAWLMYQRKRDSNCCCSNKSFHFFSWSAFSAENRQKVESAREQKWHKHKLHAMVMQVRGWGWTVSRKPIAVSSSRVSVLSPVIITITWLTPATNRSSHLLSRGCKSFPDSERRVCFWVPGKGMHITCHSTFLFTRWLTHDSWVSFCVRS